MIAERKRNHQINKGRKTIILLNAEQRNEAVCWIVSPDERNECACEIGSAESKKGLLFFITALSFGFKCSVEWKLVKATGTAQRNKANDCSLTA